LWTPCVTIRDSTEQPETLSVGVDALVGTDPDDIVNGAKQQISQQSDWNTPFGDGDAADRILSQSNIT